MAQQLKTEQGIEELKQSGSYSYTKELEQSGESRAIDEGFSKTRLEARRRTTSKQKVKVKHHC